MPDWLAQLLITLLKAVLVAFALLTTFAYMTLVERRLLARMQIRVGPNRVGPMGLLQPAADAIKSIFKEDLSVTLADKLVYTLAPILAIGMALTAFGGIPAGPPKSLFGTDPWVYNLDAGILALLALTSMGVYGIFLGGWASGSKYPILGGLRSSAQMISYELGMGLSILGLLMLVGSTSFLRIVEWQALNGWLILFQVLGFALFLVSSFAETNRTPFDLPEAEQELVAGYLTEYSAIKWALFQMAEYVNMITASAVMSTLFFGGYRGPVFLDALIPGISGWPLIWLILKIAFFLFLFIWVRATLPRLRYDQLMRFGWKLVLPVALANTLLTAAFLAFGRGVGLWLLGLLSLAGLLLLFALSDRVRTLWNTPTQRQEAEGARIRTLGGD
ncbi:NADH-quinone oxidoreductase subunit NuoH [Deinococcus metallilatus]|uniref:NADH-quinone oxidoreductase subunit H n=1 Tax=Deinococcus metallilatus TaxID=1211322 RepID=A0AAJ5JX67_9DEIO|nr:NADH-quinone oxidoreductase subunit NuoH [Deinococcus metallilatus]MBB5294348.1 NADH-quinone oxidoreductase subunit H [Deinococcus metallilatus]QBY09118.1 NADH-quinone oxidoreductase subunit NuoH [Deinococcus metallilatus]RXJ10262.1 NADH-quinone oxidoreductase subunit NuoH [Deinococcus metallilatus]TLK22554.1 NADH-quinone oxidoreductase subunit NuoH [Deinococcus metallilatus]GMA16314.1 NADH-quinone oxidoreductase subunit H [Deinococcus metallilatus]